MRPSEWVEAAAKDFVKTALCGPGDNTGNRLGGIRGEGVSQRARPLGDRHAQVTRGL